MKHRVVVQLCALLVFATACADANAEATLLSYWNFNNSDVTGAATGQPGVFLTTGSTEVYNSTLKTLSPASDGLFPATSVLDLSNLVGTMGSNDLDTWGVFLGDVSFLNSVGTQPETNNNGVAVKGTGNNGRSITFALSSTGYEDLVLTYAGRRSSNASGGFTMHEWSYSTNGVDFTSAGNIGFTGTAYELKTLDLSSVPEVDDASALYMRVTFTGATDGSNPNTRVDDVQFNATAISSLVAGDYDGNGFVDAADYVIWRKNNGLMGGATVADGDGTGDGNVLDDDYDFWRERFGNPSGSAGGALVGGVIPEPSAMFLLMTGFATLAVRRQRLRSAARQSFSRQSAAFSGVIS